MKAFAPLHFAAWPAGRLSAAGLLLCLLLAVFWIGNASAAARVALLIGNKDYAHQTTLSTPLNDIALMETTLKAQGFTVVTAPNLDKRNMDRAIQKFVTDSSAADVAFFYYAGHGQQPLKGGRNFLLSVDARITSDDDLETEAVSADHIVRRLEDASRPARLRLVVLDACRNNPKGWRTRDQRGLAPIQTGDQYTLVGFSTNDRAPALDSVDNSPYSPYAKALSQWLGRSADMSVRRIFDRTAEEVRQMTRDKQQPRTSGDLPVDTLLGGGSADGGQEADAWSLAQKRGSLAAVEAFLKEFPSGRFAPQARVMLADLRSIKPESVSQPLTAAATAQGPRPGQAVKDCAACPELVLLPTGSFVMGSPDGEKDRDGDEGPTRSVRIDRTIAVGRNEVTRGEFWQFVTAAGYKTEAEKAQGCAAWDGKEWKYDAARYWRNPGFEQGDDHPVVCVSWNDAQAYLRWLNTQVPGRNYRLLSEAEWEYAARAGQGASRFPWGDDPDYSEMCRFSNGADETAKKKIPGAGGWLVSKCSDAYAYTAPISTLQPNAFGLYHMHGNAWEWVQDQYSENYQGAPTDGRAWEIGGDASRRVLRGGSWGYNPRYLRSAYRSRGAPDIRDGNSGFRVARTF